jgi:topoisomerase IA-like protein
MLKPMQNEKVGENLGTDPKTGKPVSVRLGNLAQWHKSELLMMRKSLLV